MKKYLAGEFRLFSNGELNKYYTDDFKTFYNENDEDLTFDDLEEWAVWINSPWSQDLEKYTIECNCKDGYTEMDKSDFIWRCKYYIIGYEASYASVVGYGNTEVEALEKCKELFKFLQDNYNRDDESV